MVQTEKPMAKQEKKKIAEAKSPQKQDKTVNKKEPVVEDAKDKKDEKKTDDKKKDVKPKQTKPVVKKDHAEVNAQGLHVSTKYAVAICKFIKGKKTGDAIRDLEEVMKLKKAVPMKGEIPHRKGRIMSGRFPVRASEQFITVIKGLAGNSNVNGLEDPIIVEASASIASRPFGRFGRVRRKRTHVRLVAKDVTKKIQNKKAKEKEEKK